MPRSNLAKPKLHKNTETLYNALKYGMVLYNLRQEDLCKILKISQSTVSWHFKNHSFSDDQLNDLLDYFNLEIRVCEKSS